MGLRLITYVRKLTGFLLNLHFIKNIAMKEILLEQDKALERPQIVAEQEKEKQLKFLGSLRKVPGLTMYECNLMTGDIKPAKLDSIIDIEGNITRKLVIQPGCLYDQALNMKNAMRKFLKRAQKL